MDYDCEDFTTDAILKKKKHEKIQYESNDNIFVIVQQNYRLRSGACLLLLKSGLKIQAMASQYSTAHADLAVPLQEYKSRRQESSNFEPIEPRHNANRWGAQTT